MPITEVPNKNVSLTLPKFTCDNCLGDHIPPPLPNQHHAMLFAGKAGSGKTSLSIGLLTSKKDKRVYRKVYDHIFVIAPPNSISSLKNNVFKRHPADKVFSELTGDVLQHIIDFCKTASLEEQDNTLIYIDDMAVFLKNKFVQAKLNEIIANRRHYRISIHLLVQSYMFVPLMTRRQLTHMFMFRPSNKKELEAVADEVIYLSKDQVAELSKVVWRDPHDHLLIDVSHAKFYRNFNELIISE
jgi:hypothetical protein